MFPPPLSLQDVDTGEVEGSWGDSRDGIPTAFLRLEFCVRDFSDLFTQLGNKRSFLSQWESLSQGRAIRARPICIQSSGAHRPSPKSSEGFLSIHSLFKSNFLSGLMGAALKAFHCSVRNDVQYGSKPQSSTEHAATGS